MRERTRLVREVGNLRAETDAALTR